MSFIERLQHTWNRSSGNRVEFFRELYFSLDARLEKYYTRPAQYKHVPLQTALDELEVISQKSLRPFLEEDGLKEIEGLIQRRARELGHDQSGDTETYARQDFARLYYALCRAYQPEVVLETGVAYGRSSAYILKALAQNGSGVLHSVDRPLPIPDAEARIGILIPDDLKSRWKLHLGTGYTLLPKILPTLGSIGLFIHDSRHTYRNMKYEFKLVYPYLKKPGFILSDDADQNPAFHEFAAKTHPAYWTTVVEGGSRLLGVSYFR